MRKFIFLAISFLFITGFFTAGCHKSDLAEGDSAVSSPEDFNQAIKFLDSLLNEADFINLSDTAGIMPDSGCIKLSINYPGGSLRQLFCDSNKLHYEVAESIGIRPLYKDSVMSLWMSRPLYKITSNQYYFVDELRHSYPFLVPEGKNLLDHISKRFHDTLQARGGGNYRLKITSLLRTGNSVSNLRRVNRASVDSSAHLFGTTFDISFTNFPYGGGTPHRTQEDLKNLLAEILYDFRNEGRCYIIYEHRRGCFHITPRK